MIVLESAWCGFRVRSVWKHVSSGPSSPISSQSCEGCSLMNYTRRDQITVLLLTTERLPGSLHSLRTESRLLTVGQYERSLSKMSIADHIGIGSFDRCNFDIAVCLRRLKSCQLERFNTETHTFSSTNPAPHTSSATPSYSILFSLHVSPILKDYATAREDLTGFQSGRCQVSSKFGKCKRPGVT